MFAAAERNIFTLLRTRQQIIKDDASWPWHWRPKPQQSNVSESVRSGSKVLNAHQKQREYPPQSEKAPQYTPRGSSESEKFVLWNLEFENCERRMRKTQQLERDVTGNGNEQLPRLRRWRRRRPRGRNAASISSHVTAPSAAAAHCCQPTGAPHEFKNHSPVILARPNILF